MLIMGVPVDNKTKKSANDFYISPLSNSEQCPRKRLVLLELIFLSAGLNQNIGTWAPATATI